jgi:regulator of sigma D
LVLAKHFNGICPSAMGKAFYRLVNRALCLQFCDVLVSHLSSYHFGVVVRKGCEVMIHNIQATLDAHLDWVVLQVNIINIFNTILHKAIFLKRQEMGGQLS